MKELNQMKKFKIQYFDSGYVRSGKFQLVKKEMCFECTSFNGRGFMVTGSEYPNNTHFVCLNCSPFFLSDKGYKIEEYMELCLYDTHIIRRYSDLRKRFMEKAISEDNFLEHRNEYAKYIYSSIMEAVNYLIDLDREYPLKSYLGPKWNGWWLGAGGNELDLFFSWLRTSLEKPQYASVIDKYRTSNKEGRIPPGVNECHKITEEFKQKIKVEKKFKR